MSKATVLVSVIALCAVGLFAQDGRFNIPGSANAGIAYKVADPLTLTADYQRMYQLIRQPAPIDDQLFEIEFLDAGVETFVFTFG